jgi:ABC-2 type transport system permease protein
MNAVLRTQEFYRVLVATAERYIKRQAAYTIELIRWPVLPVVLFVVFYLTYSVTGRDVVSGYPVGGFLLVGVLGMVLWTTNLWASGYAIEFERREGTLECLFLSPANRSAVVLGYGAGSLLVLVVPTMIVLGAISAALRISLDIASPVAVVLAILALLVASAASGYVLAGFFVLTRRANVIANFLQAPIYLLSGAFVPVTDLPESLQFFARMFPMSYGMDAIREAMMNGANVSELLPSLVAIATTSIGLFVVGAVLIGKVERNARAGAELDFE